MPRTLHASLIAVAVIAIASPMAHAGKLLVSEVLYNEVGSPFSGEWIELYNGSDAAVDLSNYKVGDEETKGATSLTEGMFQFPSGASIAPGQVQIVSSFASRFNEVYGFKPTYEVGSSVAADAWVDDATVPNMSVYTPWDPDGAKLNMSNTDDQFLLLDGNDNAVDAASWGSTFFFNPGLAPTTADGQSYSRIDPNVDTDTAADWVLTSAAPAGAFWTTKSTPGTLPVPAISTWIADADGAWTIDPNWQDDRIPGTSGDTVIFGNAITAPRDILLNTAETVGTLRFDSAFSYTIDGSDTLTLDRTGGTTSIEVNSGSHVINVPMTFAKATTVDVATGATLSLTNTINMVAVGLTKNGGGTLTTRGVRAASLQVNAGTLAISAATPTDGTTKVGTLGIATGATFDLHGNKLIVDYAAATASPLATVSAAIKDGRLGSTTITDPTRRAIGIVDTAATAGFTTFGGVDVDTTSLVAAETYRGDANLDFAVDFNDLLALAKNYNLTTGGTWEKGDSDYDGDVDFNDLLSLAKNYNLSGTSAGSADMSTFSSSFKADWSLAQSLVPEPATLGVMGFGLVAFARRRGR